MNDRQLNSTNYPIQILLVSSGDHITGMTGVVPFVYISKGSQPFYLASGSVTENGYGVYSLNGNAFDRNTLGPCAVHATGLGCDPFDTRYDVVAYNPFDANLGLTNLDAAISSRQPSGSVSVSGGTINTLTGTVTVGTNNDKGGYSLGATQSFNNTGQTTAFSVSGGSINSVGTVTGVVNATGTMNINFAQQITSPQVSGSVGGALLAAETQGVGKWTIVGNTLTLYRYDGQTVVRVFQFDNASSPTSRS